MMGNEMNTLAEFSDTHSISFYDQKLLKRVLAQDWEHIGHRTSIQARYLFIQVTC